ncbi:hypothetical protein Mapa_005432 [Marchantia paleacea]|nr:hypothetical protein Mapa_005432 [Marchantia paleacea]
MMNSIRKRSKSESISSRLKGHMGVLVQKVNQHIDHIRRRTKGIEVQMLRDDDSVKLSVWNLAGQFIFRALQDLLFPRSNQACNFAFVFSPTQVKGKGKGSTNHYNSNVDVNVAFANELKTWIRFIVSNLQVGGQRPQVLVIITHMDKLKRFKSSYDPTFTRETVQKFQELHADQVDLCPGPSGGTFHVNAKDRDEVRPNHFSLPVYARSTGKKDPCSPNSLLRVDIRVCQGV